MEDSSLLRINARVAIPRAELHYRASRAGGPGGQHVNTSSTRIELWWDVATSSALTEAERDRLRTNLASRLDSVGRLRVVSAAHRSQLQNREAATRRLQAIVADGLRVARPRRATRPTQASRERRLTDKKHRGAIKRDRRETGDE